MGHSRPPTSGATDNTAASRIVTRTAKQKISRAIDMRFYWICNRIQQNHFHVPGILCHKTPPNTAPQKYDTKIFETNNKIHRKLKRPTKWNRKRVCRNYQSQGSPLFVQISQQITHIQAYIRTQKRTRSYTEKYLHRTKWPIDRPTNTAADTDTAPADAPVHDSS